jgi:ribonucleotide reductase, class II
LNIQGFFFSKTFFYHDSTMVRELQRLTQTTQFPETAPAANPVFFRTYSRRIGGGRETWEQVCDRTLRGLVELGKLTPAEAAILEKMQKEMKSLPSGRWLWVGGTEWISRPENFSGAYNCTSTNVVDWRAFGLMMDLAMMGCGTGAILEPQYINQLPVIRNRLHVTVEGEIGTNPASERREETEVQIEGNIVNILVGDSRRGWVKSYQTLLELSTNDAFSGIVHVSVNLSNIRPAGEILKGFGGVANPIKLPELYQRCAAILNKAVGRQLNSVECCLLIDEAAVVVVAGNVRRSAGMRQGNSNDELFEAAKTNLWQQDESGNWRIDPDRDALRMANHSRVFHQKPTLEECINAVRNQYYSGEGAIQWAGEAIARANHDLLNTSVLKAEFLKAYSLSLGNAKQWLQEHYPQMSVNELEHRLSRYGLNPCHSGDTLVSTEQGLVPIKDLVDKQFKALVDLRSVGLDGVKLTNAIAFTTGVQHTYLITLHNGMKMKCTSEHKHFTNKGWVATKELTLEHSIFIQKGEGQFGSSTISIEQAQMLGWWFGDGFQTIEKAKIGVRKTDRTVRGFYFNSKEFEYAYPIITSALESIGGTRYAYHINKGIYRVHCCSFLIDSFFNKLNISSKASLPVSFFSQSREVVIGFLQGLFSADGSVQKYRQAVELFSASQKLLEQVQILLLNLGIPSCIYRKNSAGSIKVPYTLKDGTIKNSYGKEYYRLVIRSIHAQKYSELVGFPLAPEKQAILQEHIVKNMRKRRASSINLMFASTVKSVELQGEETVYDLHVPLTHSFIANGCVTHNCGEILGADFHCNLSEVHLNQIEPKNDKEQEEAFTAGALSVASLLNHKFLEPRYQFSRELDPIVGVSFTGLFDFFVRAFGVDWLRWWEQGRPEEFGIRNSEFGIENMAEYFRNKEREYLNRWRDIVFRVVWEYCDRHHIKRPNRCTTVQPSGTKSLLTGASPGWHPPKAQRFIRRITFRKNDPVALACIDYGYAVIPSQSDKDENGNLLNDPFDPRCMEWLVEIPVAVPWADLSGADEIEISKFSAPAQMDFYMQVQKYYVTHNTSATIELRENEVEALGTRIYEAIQNDEGYISAALLARFDDLQTFPRLPFEPITKAKYEELMQQVHSRRQVHDFYTALSRYDAQELDEAGPAGCDSDKCLFPQVEGK